jgi:hypothetical protein
LHVTSLSMVICSVSFCCRVVVQQLCPAITLSPHPLPPPSPVCRLSVHSCLTLSPPPFYSFRLSFPILSLPPPLLLSGPVSPYSNPPPFYSLGLSFLFLFLPLPPSILLFCLSRSLFFFSLPLSSILWVWLSLFRFSPPFIYSWSAFPSFFSLPPLSILWVCICLFFFSPSSFSLPFPFYSLGLTFPLPFLSSLYIYIYILLVCLSLFFFSPSSFYSLGLSLPLLFLSLTPSILWV